MGNESNKSAIKLEDMENPRFTTGDPIILVHKSNPKAIVGGYALKVNGKTIEISYANPLNMPPRLSRTALTSGDRSYYLASFDRYKDFKNIELLSFDTNIIGKIDVGLGDFITLGIDQKTRVCGFISEIKPKTLMLSHQNPLLEDRYYTSSSEYSNRLNCRKEMTIGTRTYNLSFFNCFSILMRAGQLAQEEIEDDVILK